MQAEERCLRVAEADVKGYDGYTKILNHHLRASIFSYVRCKNTEQFPTNCTLSSVRALSAVLSVRIPRGK